MPVQLCVAAPGRNELESNIALPQKATCNGLSCRRQAMGKPS